MYWQTMHRISAQCPYFFRSADKFWCIHKPQSVLGYYAHHVEGGVVGHRDASNIPMNTIGSTKNLTGYLRFWSCINILSYLDRARAAIVNVISTWFAHSCSQFETSVWGPFIFRCCHKAYFIFADVTLWLKLLHFCCLDVFLFLLLLYIPKCYL